MRKRYLFIIFGIISSIVMFSGCIGTNAPESSTTTTLEEKMVTTTTPVNTANMTANDVVMITTPIVTTTTVSPEDLTSCVYDWDCACGMSKDTGECIIGNKNFIFGVLHEECIEFCSSAKKLCIENKCT